MTGGRARADVTAVAALAAMWLAVLALVGAGGDFPLNDDWAYAWSVRHLVATGELRILDWVAPSLVAHVAWGALLARAFGPSAVVLRLGTVGLALVGAWLLYGIGRRSGFEPARAALFACAIVLSPWYLNLSFTFMTDVPWLVAMLGAFWLVLGGRGALRWAAAGALVAAAALSRQLAVLVAPAFVLLAIAEARADGRRDLRAWLGRALAFGAPLVVSFGAFSLWYARVHGPTLANRQTWRRMALAHPLLPVAHALAIWHYVGLWLLPVVAALAAARAIGRTVTRAQATVAALALVGYAIAAWVLTYTDADPSIGLDAWLPPTMPYLGNIVFVAGAGPLTLYDSYVHHAPYLHEAAWASWGLSALSTASGVVATGIVVRGVRRLRGPLDAAGRARLLFVATGAIYLAWHLATARFVFDRYLLPLMPVAWWLALDVAPEAARSRLAWALVAAVAVFSVGATHEYLAWNGARDRAVRALEARGVSSDQIDAGFEPNAERHFIDWFRRTGRLDGERPNLWWVKDARYRLAFWPSTRCPTVAEYPFWSWGASRAIRVLDCAMLRR